MFFFKYNVDILRVRITHCGRSLTMRVKTGVDCRPKHQVSVNIEFEARLSLDHRVGIADVIVVATRNRQ